VTQAVRRRAFTAKTRVESQAAPCGIVVEKVLLRQNIPRVSLFSEYLGFSLYYSRDIPFSSIHLSPTLSNLSN
jgi:hypothetical protein